MKKKTMLITCTEEQKEHAKAVADASPEGNLSRLVLRLLAEHGNKLGIDQPENELPKWGGARREEAEVQPDD